jgi:predicted nucleic acid-binding Zn ribbon protein
MPAYRYQCVQCQAQEIRIGGLDDHVAICIACGVCPVFRHRAGPRGTGRRESTKFLKKGIH